MTRIVVPFASIRVPSWFVVAGLLVSCTAVCAQGWVRTTPSDGAFPLVAPEGVATLVVSPADEKVVSIAVADLASDIERVTGRKPQTTATPFEKPAGPLVLAGTLGRHPLIDQLAASARLSVEGLKGAWETFVIQTVSDPFPGVRQALVIAGSDRRGTAFGVYELSQAIGVSPWHWWADVTPERKDALYVQAGTRRFGPPSVKYRGIFLNDEDWGLQPWAAKTFESENGDIGPKTYAKIFELMLRLKANMVWPAMHACTKPFNAFPENKRVADDYAIVMGSSHAEPMLRNNVGEWKDEHAKYNYVTNREGVLAYWEQRVRENGQYENIYTLGMRGIHDSAIQGTKTDAQRIQVLEQVFSDQRALLAKYARPGDDGEGRTQSLSGATAASPSVEAIPQMFCAYKEVLGLYRQGLKVPDDVTIVWPDDNFGYIRNHATAEERKRSGGFGVYYHLSYLGAPMAYLWLYTTPPALVWEEMSKAYDHGARTMWIANVGDLKPAEIGTEFFLQMAWDINRWTRESQRDFLRTWAAREFGAEAAGEIAAILAEYFELNYQRKPEHLQWWLPKQAPRASPLTPSERENRLTRFAELRQRTKALEAAIPAAKRDAWFELVAYPVHGSALAKERYFQGEIAALSERPAEREASAAKARSADAALKELTRVFNEEIAGGKWRLFMQLEPADDDWKSFRISPWQVPAGTNGGGGAPPSSADTNGMRRTNGGDGAPPSIADTNATRSTNGGDGAPPSRGHEVILSVEAEDFASKRSGQQATWEIIPGLGRTGDSVALFPTTAPAAALDQLATHGSWLEYPANFPAAGEYNVTFNLIPTQPIRAGAGLRFAIALGEEQPRQVVVNVRDGSPEWAQGVLNATVTTTVSIQVATPGPDVLRVYGVDAGVVIDKLYIFRGTPPTSYLGPAATHR